MVVLWQKKHLANIPTSKTPTSANSSEWTQQNQTLAEKRCCGSIQHTGSWGTKPFSPPCLGVSLLLLGNRISPNYPGSQLLPFSSFPAQTQHITQCTQRASQGHKIKKSLQHQFILLHGIVLLYPNVILTGRACGPELDLWAYLRASFWQTRSWTRCSRACRPRGCSCGYRCGKEWKAADGRSQFSPCHPPWSQRRDIPPRSPPCRRRWWSARRRSRSCSAWPRWRWRFGTRPSASGRAWGADTGTQRSL